jgi:hypothetical protein
MDPRLSLESDPHEQIARLESEIEALGESAARCRKVALGARGAIAAGCVLFAAMLIGVIEANALWLMIAAICAMGGIVLYGSNRTTAEQIAARIANAERLRAALIGEMELTLVPEPSRLLH